MKRLILLCILACAIAALATVCYRQQSYRYKCGRRWRRSRCTGYTQVSYCCPGWTGAGCNTPFCGGKTDPGACTLNEGNVKVSASGPVHTSSGGTCFRPDHCTNCNEGYYADGGRCRACTEIANCHYPNCTSPSNSRCKYCKGVVRDDQTQYGWWAYTRWIDEGLSCKLACSWREGNRCYPGSCSDTTVESCNCSSGFSGTDCSQIVEKPVVLGSFVQLKHVGETTTELVDAPGNISAPSPQEVVYTNNVNLQTADAYVDAQYVKTLPETPADFYVKREASYVGIIDGGVSLNLLRGLTNPALLSLTCPEDPPMPNNYRCNKTFSLTEAWSDVIPFQHADRIEFETFATNGGFITVYDREDNDKEVKYNFQGETTTFKFEIVIDTEVPDHCSLSTTNCNDTPLDVLDISVKTSIPVAWKGWYDSLAGIESYHFEVFHLRSTGPGESSQLKHGDKVPDVIPTNVPATVANTTLKLSSPGPYSVTIAAFDKAGNHRTARGFLIFDDQSKVDIQGVRTRKAGNSGECTWQNTPAAPIVANANPNANCDWIVKFGPIHVVWNNHFINTRHHAGHWLHAVEPLDHIESALDDHEGPRQVEQINNVQGIVAFQLSYNVIHEGQVTHTSWYNVTDIQAQEATINQTLNDGMLINMTLRGLDITGAFADQNILVKVDSSPPILTDLWLTLGDMNNVSVHKSEDLALLTFEWVVYDVESGIHEVQWRIYDNFTGEEFEHGSAFESPQGDTETLQQCKDDYDSYPRGAECYCTPFEGCFHRHFQVKPIKDSDGTNGLNSNRHIGTHDYEYFIEVKVSNRAMLSTTIVKKISIDVSPPVAGTVCEGHKGSPEVDFQQDREVNVHWKDFFDKESGVLFYDYITGPACFGKDTFAVNLENTDQWRRTYLDFASFTVPADGTYYVTVVAYNRALDMSAPVCSDGITIDSSTPSISNVNVVGTTTEPGPVRTVGDNVWYIHADRQIQLVENPAESCKNRAIQMGASELSLYPLKLDSQGRQMNITNLDCDQRTSRSEIISYTTLLDRIELSWNMDSNVHTQNTEIGLASPESDEPDIVEFQSAYHHANKRLEHINLLDGQMFNILMKTTSKSGVINVQNVGPFVTDSSPPAFDGEIYISHNLEDKLLIATWNEAAFRDTHNIGTLAFQYSVGTQPYRTDLQDFHNLEFNEHCLHTDPPQCTAVNILALDWSLHHKMECYITIKATNQVGLSVMAVSPRYIHDVLKPSTGVVLDTAGNIYDHLRHDYDYQLSRTEMEGEWFGFESLQSVVTYTICLAKDSKIVDTTCKDVGTNTNGILHDLNLEYFTVYQFAVIAHAIGGNTTVFSDGVMPVDTDLKLTEMTIYDGIACDEQTDLHSEQLTHHEQIVPTECLEDLEYQRSLGVLSTYWSVPHSYMGFIPDVFWKIQQRAPIAEYWEDITKEVHIPTSTAKLSTRISLESGRTYRFMVTFCADQHCFPSLYTNGVTVTHYPPKTGHIGVEYDTDITTKLKVTMDRFIDPDIEDPKEAREAISHYEWAIVDDDHAGRTVDRWTRMTNINELDTQRMSFEIQLKGLLTFKKCWRFSVRGYNKAGLYSSISKDIHDCEDGFTVRDPLVLDCVGPSDGDESSGGNIAYIQNTFWEDKDKDYTPYNNVISAVWPNLRYPKYSYVVIASLNADSILFHDEVSSLDIRSPCDVPNALGCGYTDQNFISVYTQLEHGKRYAVCIHANATTIQYEQWKEDEELPEQSVCSDGITVDMSSPTPGIVYINGQHAIYQQSLTDISVVWESFVDVEELSNAPHSTGITYYEVAIGTHRGDSDVHEFTKVNVTNHYIFNGLRLQNGYRYYATVKGYDFIGRYSLAYSAPIITDNTAPTLSNESISADERHISEKNGINICWRGLFSDAESGIVQYEYAIGSRSGYDDIQPYTRSEDECVTTTSDIMNRLEEGHVYFISIRGTNGAGLSTNAASWATIVDFSPPITGSVFDGIDHEEKDVDFQTEQHTLRASWTGFHDPHTSIEEYFVHVGTNPGLDDIIEKQSNGIREDLHFDNLHLREGQVYYVTVTACNTAGLCSSVTSDGLIIDSSAPVPGIVNDGVAVDDMEYQSSRSYIACKWLNFVDAESDISHYTWRLGTVVGGDDIIAATAVNSANEIVIPDVQTATGHALPTHTRLYSTVRAYNKAGLMSESTSNGFEVDDTGPVFTTSLTHVPIGSLKPSTSILRNMLKFRWNAEDVESHIHKQYISIVSHRGEDFNSSVQIPGLVRDYTFTDISLHDGSLYDVVLHSCNGANLCASSSITDVLVDSSMPTAGTFAIHTDHAANLHRQQDWMTWSTSSLNLAIIGFSDEHSGIVGYHINIGSSYMESDLNMDPRSAVYAPHNEDTSHFSNDGGKVQIFTIQTRSLASYDHVFVTLWAENGVGLMSELVHSQFKLIPGGFMELVRRCSHYSCQGHCVCAAQDRKCPTDSSTEQCHDATADGAYAAIRVTDRVDIDSTTNGITHTPTNPMLAAKWDVIETNKIQPKWYEWSIGVAEESEPHGIFTSTDRTWHDAGRRMNLTFTLTQDKTLHENEKYSVFVRAWYDSRTYATFKSQGLIVNHGKPQISNLFGKSVKEVSSSSNKDIDVSNETQALFIDWTGSFIDTFGMLSKYKVFISPSSGARLSFADVGRAQLTSHRIITATVSNGNNHKLSQVSSTRVGIPISELKPGVHYYSSLQGYTFSGLHTYAVSDGFLIDSDIPKIGTVLDGTNLLDWKYQNQSRMLAAHWHGFTDIHSCIVSYTWCVSSADKTGMCDIVPQIELGMETIVSRPPQREIENGQMVVNEVFATDEAGHTSQKALSNGIVIDRTAPIPVRQTKHGNNLLKNPSFEDADNTIDLEQLKPNRTCKAQELSSWNVAGCLSVVTGTVREGNSALWIRGNISQAIPSLNEGHTYYLALYAAHIPSKNSTILTEEISVQFGDERHLFQLYSRPGHSGSSSESSWQLISCMFQSRDTSQALTLGTLPRSNGILLDNVVLTEMTDDDTDNGGLVSAHAVLVHGFSSIYASWKCSDPESGIQNYVWAIGTVRGGCQYQKFTSVGQRQFGTNTKLNLLHSTALYITVIATNAAGMKTEFYSAPLLIDRTPPLISSLNDGPNKDEDQDFQRDREITFTFDVSDDESGVKECSWALGTLDDYNLVSDYRPLQDNARTDSWHLPVATDISRPFYVTVKCVNNVGLTSEMRSDGIQVILSPPDVSDVILDILGSSDTLYPTRDLYQGPHEELRLRWSGFKVTDKVKLYQVNVVGETIMKTFEVSDTGVSSTFVHLPNVTVDEGEYSCVLTGVNEIGLTSEPIVKNFTVILDSPDIKDTNALSMTWDPLTQIVLVDWQGVFFSSFDLYYEVSVGTAAYSTDVIMWQETVSTHIDFKLTQEAIGEFGKEIYVVVSAITPAGTYKTFSTSQLITDKTSH